MRTITTRARRYDMELPFLFRWHGATEWLIGELANISRTGLLFRTNFVLPLQDEFEARFNARTLDDRVGAEIRCACAVVRLEATNNPPAIAARILRSEMSDEVEYPWN